MARVSANELAELVPSSVDEISRLDNLGLLVRGEDELYASTDVHVVRLMAAFEEACISLDDVARGVSTGGLSFPLGLFLPEPAPRPQTFEQLGEQLGRVRRTS